jgi:hypothetical protein
MDVLERKAKITYIENELKKGLKLENTNGLIVEGLMLIAKQNEEVIKLLDKIEDNTTPNLY